MTQITINIEDNTILPHLKKILNAIEGVSIVNQKKKHKKSGIEESYEDVRAGRVTSCDSVDDMFKQILGIRVTNLSIPQSSKNH